MKTTIGKIAMDCGVSVATVSRVIANKSNVSEKTKTKILKRMRELDYATEKVNMLLDSKKHILFIAENIGRTSNVALYRAAATALSEFNYITVLCECKDVDMRKNMIEYARNAYSGCLLISGSIGNAGLNVFENDSFPMVAIHWCNDFGKINSVVDDLRRGSYLAIKHLYENGHKNIALICPRQNASGCKEMILGYKEAFDEFGLEVNENLIFYSDLSGTSGAEIIEIICNEFPHTTAVVCANQNIAKGAMAKMSLLHKAVPEDISFVALNVDSAKSGMITCVGSPSNKVGGLAARMLYDIINGNNTLDLPESAKILLEPEVFEGKTVIKLD